MKNFKFKINGNNYDVEVKNVENNIAEVEVNGTIYKVEVDKEIQVVKTPKLVRSQPVIENEVSKTEEVKPAVSAPKAGGKSILSPLPGVILELMVRVGDQVSVGQKLIVLEAMKMENNIESEITGKIIDIKISKGDSVMQGDVLIVIG